jgi:hypothetical protein
LKIFKPEVALLPSLGNWKARAALTCVLQMQMKMLRSQALAKVSSSRARACLFFLGQIPDASTFFSLDSIQQNKSVEFIIGLNNKKIQKQKKNQ